MTSPAAPDRPAVSARRRRLEVLAVSALGALLVYLGVRLEAAGAVLGLGYVVLLLPAVADRWRAPLLGFVPGFLVAMVLLNRELAQFAWYVPLVLVPILGLHYLLMPLFAYLLRRVTAWPAWAVIPLAMGAEEWLRPLIGVGSYNMFQAGTFLAAHPVIIQAADIVGSTGLTVLWALPLAALAEVARWRIDGAPAAERRWLVSGGLAGAAALAFLLGYGAWQLSRAPFVEGPRIAVVQPSEDHEWDNADRLVQVQQQLTAQHVEPGTVDLVAWPENAVLLPYERVERYRRAVRWVATSRRAPLLFGTQGYSPAGDQQTASAYLVDVDGELRGRYDKMVLFPFTEGRAFPLLDRMAPSLARRLDALSYELWGATPTVWAGQQAQPLRLPGSGPEGTFWTPVCYDSCYTRLGREAARRGARFFVNITSEGWMGWALSNNQMAVNTLRAVENRVGVVRAGNTGISGFIRPDGRVDRYLYGQQGRRHLDKGVLVHHVLLDRRWPTVYARWGGPLSALWPALWAGSVAWGLCRRRAALPRVRTRTA
jgi:apolipoprotein N-acyltransferase